MRKMFILLLLIATPMQAIAGEWWESQPASESLPQLIQVGYKIVGFTTIIENTALMDLKVNRYILQKDAAVYLCVEKIQASGGATMLTNCYGLRK